MSHSFSWEAFSEFPIVGILRGFSANEISAIVEACLRGGLTNIEITMNTEGVSELIGLARELSDGKLNVGAGTVCSKTDLEQALAAGAEYIVTPVCVPEVIQASVEAGVPIFPGAFTPTEVYQAWSCGASMVKLFPAGELGPSYIKAVKAPLDTVKILATGGVTPESLADYAKAGAEGFGVGSPLFNTARVRAGDFDWVENQIKRFKEAWNECKA